MTKASLSDEALAFAAQHKARSGPRCCVCGLPADVLGALGMLLDKGYGWSVMERWLESIGHGDIHTCSIGKHFRDGHHKAK